jgi:hypothetical protein
MGMGMAVTGKSAREYLQLDSLDRTVTEACAYAREEWRIKAMWGEN